MNAVSHAESRFYPVSYAAPLLTSSRWEHDHVYGAHRSRRYIAGRPASASGFAETFGDRPVIEEAGKSTSYGGLEEQSAIGLTTLDRQGWSGNVSTGNIACLVARPSRGHSSAEEPGIIC